MALNTRNRWALLITVSAGLVLVSLDNSILYTALPTLTEELGATGSQSLWIINAYPVVMAGLLLGSGTLSDRIGHSKMFAIGLIIFGLASAAAAFSPSAGLLIAARAVLAVGAAAMMPATLALIRVTFEVERERNLAIAIWGSLSVIGAALGPIVGGLLLEHFWWGSVFLINIPVVIAALAATAVVAPANDPDPSKKWDWISSMQAMAALVGAVFLIKEIAHTPQNWTVAAIATVVAVVGSILFTRRQNRLEQPLLEFGIFKNPAFTSGVLAAAFSMFAIAGAQLVITQRFQLVEGFTPLQSGLLVATVAVGSLPTSLIGGAFLHRIGLLPLITGGLALGDLGVVGIIAGTQSHSFGLLIAGLAVTGAGLGAAMSVASTAIVGNVSPRRAGMASSIEEESYEFGSLTAVALLGSLVTFVYSATVELPEGTPESAGNSLSDALLVANGNQDIITAANTAFDTGFLITMVVLAVILAIGAAITGWLLRHHGPGSISQAHAASH
jgi:DHA2 family multidrug resistance protein-like MFS transporter